jgi:hypothetical protein
VSSVAVSDTASAHDGLALKVNGQAVGVNPDGTWSTTVALNLGANTITAVASDGSGNTTQASETVSFVPPAPPAIPNPALSFCIVPNVTGKSLSKAAGALLSAHCRVGAITKVKSKTFRNGTVEHASVPANSVLALNSPVGLTVSSGKPKKHAKKHTTLHRA